MESENTLLNAKHLLLCVDVKTDPQTVLDAEYDLIRTHFCGFVCVGEEGLKEFFLDDDVRDVLINTSVYMCGDINKMDNLMKNVHVKTVYVIRELSYNFKAEIISDSLIGLGQVPINVNHVGVLFRNMFDNNLFQSIINEHKFQKLTESNKSGSAFRKGLYISKVKKVSVASDLEGLKFNLLRCSTNLDGPTDNFRETDEFIVNKLNDVSSEFFSEKTELNHILAQVYENNIEEKKGKRKEHRAKIKAHSDKTKDMPRNGIMAFCTFYDHNFECSEKNLKRKFKKSGLFDYTYKCNSNKSSESILTRLHFKLKSDVKQSVLNGYNNFNLVEQFDVLLYPGSVFMMPLSTNRLYTHEICPPILPIENFPVRMGYVVRCSKTNAISVNNKTFIINNDNLNNMIELKEPTDNGVKHLKETYLRENTTSDIINYDKFFFSLNNGDYMQPNY